MLTNRSWTILFGAWMLQAWWVSTACGQMSVREQFTTSGTVEAVAAGRLIVRDEEGSRLEVRLQGRDDRGVMLSDGALLAFPAEVQITGAFDVATLKPGQMVRFRGRLNAGGRSDGEVDELTLIDAEGAAIGVTFDEEPRTPLEFVACGVTAAVKQVAKGRLTVQLPQPRSHLKWVKSSRKLLRFDLFTKIKK